MTRSDRDSYSFVDVAEDWWDKTALVEARLADSPFYEEPGEEAPHGFYAKRAIIGRDMPVNKGVYLGSGRREAIVVDDEKDPMLKIVYDELVKRQTEAAKVSSKAFNENMLEAVFSFVQEVIPYSDGVERSIRKGLAADRKVGLGKYIEMHGGVCRHQSLLGAYLLEKLKSEGLLEGKVSVDRNSVPMQGGHAWIRFTDKDGNVHIIDPAKKYIGILNNAEDFSFYQRPEDMRQREE